MSWLLAALIPGLLMLATFGLERLESSLGISDPDGDIAALIAPSPPRVDRPTSVAPAARVAVPTELHGYAAFSGLPTFDNEPGLPTRMYRREPANPQFQPTRRVNPV